MRAQVHGEIMTALLRSVIAQIEQELSPEEQDDLARQLEREFAARRAANIRQSQLDALERLSRFAAGLPPVDAVEIVRQGREELENRAFG
jgi:hypothetical protein